ncbi:hypothetical protein JOB18_026637 [Solea senegalensis]|uniref:Uncharacterized protein n=1 Tax=Solea senegalensis TaxID=28829 RepID=A0AAV6QUW7_SOLSE|nr:uncharacterized protein LOC122765820 [Solea senegalensis]KAG7496866.1 hypothetical protein JOB18_026637 [Solea senegalensis]
MGNLTLWGAKATGTETDSGGRFLSRTIRSNITYYYTPLSGHQMLCPEKDSQTSTPLCPTSSLSPSPLPLRSYPSADPSISPLLSDSPQHTNGHHHDRSDSASTSRPLLLFFPWLGARTGAVAKYRDFYLDRGFDILLVYSSVMHFLWPQWGLNYGLEVLKILEEPEFSGRPVLILASSIGGYTFTQILTHVSQGPEKYSGLVQRVTGHIYDSLVAGSLEHMAIGLGKTLVPRFENFVKNLALLYFRLFKTQTADVYDRIVQVFHNNPITAPALFFFSEDDALCDPDAVDELIDLWRKRGVAVESRKWRESTHAAHLRCHPQEYLSTLEKFLNSLQLSSIKKA